MSDEMSAADFNAMQAKKPKRSKYGNIKAERDGFKFDSQAEARRYDQLKMLRDAGEIEGLVLQPPFPLEVNGIKVATYKADFLYWDVRNQRRVVEDVKGVRTSVYSIKAKLMKAIHGIDVEEVAA